MEKEQAAAATLEEPQAEKATVEDSFDGGLKDPNAGEPTEQTEQPKPEKEEAEEPTEQAEEEAPAEEPTAEPAKQISPALLARATALGMTVTDATEFGSDALLEKALRLVEKSQPKAEPQAPPAPVVPEVKEEELAPLSDEFDEGVVKWTKVASDQIKALRAEMNSLKAERAQAAQDNLVKEFDRGIADLGADWEDVLGKGDITQIDPKSKPYENRGRLIHRMNSLENEYQSLGIKKTFSEIQAEAARSLFPEKIVAKTKTQIRESHKKLQGTFLEKPGSKRSAASKDPEEAAVAFAEAKLRDLSSRLVDDDSHDDV